MRPWGQPTKTMFSRTSLPLVCMAGGTRQRLVAKRLTTHFPTSQASQSRMAPTSGCIFWGTTGALRSCGSTPARRNTISRHLVLDETAAASHVWQHSLSTLPTALSAFLKHSAADRSWCAAN